MNLDYLFAFIAGGTITLLVTYFEASGHPILSRLAALFPVFTWLSYLFIGRLAGPIEVSRHARFVLLGTIVAWVPYMLVIYLLAPRLGSIKAVLLALVTFLILVSIFLYFYNS